MKRSQKAASLPTKIKWVNHGGPLYLKDRSLVKHGEVFSAEITDIPDAFRDVIKPSDPVKAAEISIQPIPLVFKLKQRGGTDFYDIVDGTGKRLNEKDLTEGEAKDILDKFGSHE